MTEDSSKATSTKATLNKEEEIDAQGKRHSKIEQRDAWKERALSTFGHAPLWDKMDQCRKPVDQRLDRDRCGTIYCIPCYNRAIKRQQERITEVFQRHPSEVEQRKHLRHVTLLFDCYGFDLWAKPFPTFPYERTLAGIKYARTELQIMKRKFPDLLMLGAFEVEPMDDDARQRRYNGKAIDSLLLEGAVRDTAVGTNRLSVPPGMTKWQKHVLILHAHVLFDMKGTDFDAFDSHCRERLGNQRRVNKVPRGVLVNTLRDNKMIDESIEGIAKYPFKTFFHYDLPKRLKGLVPPDMYEDEIIASMIVGHQMLGTKRTLINIGMIKKG